MRADNTLRGEIEADEQDGRVDQVVETLGIEAFHQPDAEEDRGNARRV